MRKTKKTRFSISGVQKKKAGRNELSQTPLLWTKTMKPKTFFIFARKKLFASTFSRDFYHYTTSPQ